MWRYQVLVTTAFYFFILMAILAGALVLATMTPLFGDVSLRVVHSDAMAPSIPNGSVAISQAAPLYVVGDVVFFGGSQGQEPIIRRITKREGTSGGTQYITQGDAHGELDPFPVPSSAVHDRVVFHIPVLGYVIDAAQTRTGFLILVGVPASIALGVVGFFLSRLILQMIQRRKWQLRSRLIRIKGKALRARQVMQRAGASSFGWATSFLTFCKTMSRTNWRVLRQTLKITKRSMQKSIHKPRPVVQREEPIAEPTPEPVHDTPYVRGPRIHADDRPVRVTGRPLTDIQVGRMPIVDLRRRVTHVRPSMMQPIDGIAVASRSHR